MEKTFSLTGRNLVLLLLAAAAFFLSLALAPSALAAGETLEIELEGETVTLEETSLSERKVAKLPHDKEGGHHEALAPTCTEAGTAEYWTCSRDYDSNVYKTADNMSSEMYAESELAVPATGHNMRTVAESNSTCTRQGTRKHYQCTSCHLYFADAAGETPIDPAEYLKPLAPHDKFEHAEVSPTCAEEGSVRYWTCQNAGDSARYASGDNADSERLSEDQLKAPALGHDLTRKAPKEATCLETGMKEHWECGRCHKIYKRSGD